MTQKEKIDMKKIFYLLLLVLITSCSIGRINEAKRPLIVDRIICNPAYNGYNNKSKYIVVAFREKDFRKFVIKTDVIYSPGDIIIDY